MMSASDPRERIAEVASMPSPHLPHHVLPSFHQPHLSRYLPYTCPLIQSDYYASMIESPRAQQLSAWAAEVGQKRTGSVYELGFEGEPI